LTGSGSAPEWKSIARQRDASTNGTPIWTLEGVLACDLCRAKNRRAPRATLERLTPEKRG
jgi:hypothetical protein